MESMARHIHELLNLQIEAYLDAVARFRMLRAELMRQPESPGTAEWLAANTATITALQSELARVRAVGFAKGPDAAES